MPVIGTVGGNLSNYTLAAGQTFSFTFAVGSDETAAVSFSTSSSDAPHVDIAGAIRLTTDASEPGSDTVILAIGGSNFSTVAGSLIHIEAGAVVAIDTTPGDHPAAAILVTGSPPIQNDGLVDVHAQNSATGIEAGVFNTFPAPALDNTGTVHVVSTFSAATGVLVRGQDGFMNSGTIDVTGANFTGGVSLGDGGPFTNTGSIVAHSLNAANPATAVAFQDVLNPHFLNAGLIQGDVALSVVENDFNGVKTAAQNVFENTGQMVGAINLGFGDQTLLNEGQINGAVDLGAGNDVYDGRLGTEVGLISAGAGNDTQMGGAGFDNFQGNQGDDSESGGAGADIVVGGQGNDVQHGDDGDDVVWGNLGNDTLDGGNGADQVRGGQGDDSVSGGAGNDYISGDRGNDSESGGAGADLFHGSQDAGIDRVLDFSQAEGDRVQLDPGTTYTLSQVGADTVIDMGPTGGASGGSANQMILVGVQLSTLKDGWIFESF